MDKSLIPENVVVAINALLAPYGVAILGTAANDNLNFICDGGTYLDEAGTEHSVIGYVVRREENK